MAGNCLLRDGRASLPHVEEPPQIHVLCEHLQLSTQTARTRGFGILQAPSVSHRQPSDPNGTERGTKQVFHTHKLHIGGNKAPTGKCWCCLRGALAL